MNIPDYIVGLLNISLAESNRLFLIGVIPEEDAVVPVAFQRHLNISGVKISGKDELFLLPVQGINHYLNAGHGGIGCFICCACAEYGF